MAGNILVYSRTTTLRKVIAICACMSAFFFTSLGIDANVFEILLYYVMIGIATFSWMNHWNDEVIKPYVWGLCTAIGVVVSVVVFEPAHPVISILLTAISQVVVFLLNSMDNEL